MKAGTTSNKKRDTALEDDQGRRRRRSEICFSVLATNWNRHFLVAENGAPISPTPVHGTGIDHTAPSLIMFVKSCHSIFKALRRF